MLNWSDNNKFHLLQDKIRNIYSEVKQYWHSPFLVFRTVNQRHIRTCSFHVHKYILSILLYIFLYDKCSNIFVRHCTRIIHSKLHNNISVKLRVKILTKNLYYQYQKVHYWTNGFLYICKKNWRNKNTQNTKCKRII